MPGSVRLCNPNIHGALGSEKALNKLFTESMTKLMGHVLYFWVLFTVSNRMIDRLTFLRGVQDALCLSFTHSFSTNTLGISAVLFSRITKTN